MLSPDPADSKPKLPRRGAGRGGAEWGTLRPMVSARIGPAVFFFAATLCAGQAPAPPDAGLLVQGVQAKYRAAPWYQAVGRLAMHVIRPAEGSEARVDALFEMKLARPDFYRITWRPQDGNGAVSGAVWNDGEGPRVYLREANAYTTLASDDLALAAAAGYSFGLTHVVPSLFFPPAGKTHLLARLKGIEVEGRDDRLGEPCHVLRGVLDNGIEYRFWLATNDLRIVQVENSLGGAGSGSALPEVSRAKQEETLHAAGMEVSEANLQRVREAMEKARELLASVRGSTRQFHAHADTRTPLGPEDFAFSLPPGARHDPYLLSGDPPGEKGDEPEPQGEAR